MNLRSGDPLAQRLDTRAIERGGLIDLLNQCQLSAQFFADDVFLPDARFGCGIGRPFRHQALENTKSACQDAGNCIVRVAATSERLGDGRAGDQRLLGVEVVHMRSDVFELLDVARDVPFGQRGSLDVTPDSIQTAAQAGGVAPILLFGKRLVGRQPVLRDGYRQRDALLRGPRRDLLCEEDLVVDEALQFRVRHNLRSIAFGKRVW